MKRIISFALIFIMALSLAACKQPKEASVDPTDAPKPTETVTQPTEEPTPAPTEAPTPEPTEAPLPDDPDAIGDCIRDAEILAYMPFGDGEDCAGFLPSSDDTDTVDHGPSCFYIDGGKIYLLDTVKLRVVVFENGEKSYIPLNYSELFYIDLENLCVIGDTIYVCTWSLVAESIYAFDMSGNYLRSIELPEEVQEHYGVSCLMNADGRLALRDHKGITWAEDEAGFTAVSGYSISKPSSPYMTITCGDLEVRLFTGENTTPGVCFITEDRVIVTVKEYIEGRSYEVSYRAYDLNGELIGATVVDRRNVLCFPCGRPLFLDSDGTLYVMCLMQDGVYITRPNLRLEYTSHLGE